MAIDSKQNLSDKYFRQASGETLNLSGDTIVSGKIRYAEGVVASGATDFISREFFDANNYTDQQARAANTIVIKQLFNFTDTGSTFQFTQASNYQINTINAQLGVTVTINREDGTTAYVLGDIVPAFEKLILSVDVVGVFELEGLNGLTI